MSASYTWMICKHLASAPDSNLSSSCKLNIRRSRDLDFRYRDSVQASRPRLRQKSPHRHDDQEPGPDGLSAGNWKSPTYTMQQQKIWSFSLFALGFIEKFPHELWKGYGHSDIWVRQNPLIFSIFLIVPSYKINYAFPNSYQALTSAASTIWLSGILSLETKGSRLRLNASQPVGWTSVFQHGDSHIYVARRVTRSYYWLSHVMFHCHAVFLFCSSVYLYLFIIKECMSVL